MRVYRLRVRQCASLRVKHLMYGNHSEVPCQGRWSLMELCNSLLSLLNSLVPYNHTSTQRQECVQKSVRSALDLSHLNTVWSFTKQGFANALPSKKTWLESSRCLNGDVAETKTDLYGLSRPMSEISHWANKLLFPPSQWGKEIHYFSSTSRKCRTGSKYNISAGGSHRILRGPSNKWSVKSCQGSKYSTVIQATRREGFLGPYKTKTCHKTINGMML